MSAENPSLANILSARLEAAQKNRFVNGIPSASFEDRCRVEILEIVPWLSYAYVLPVSGIVLHILKYMHIKYQECCSTKPHCGQGRMPTAKKLWTPA